jgi:hypothetical protein
MPTDPLSFIIFAGTWADEEAQREYGGMYFGASRFIYFIQLQVALP